MRTLLILSFVFSSVCFAQSNLKQTNFKKKVFKEPLREVSVIVSDDGFYPNKIMAFEGERVRFYITSTSKKNQCFVLQKHEIFVSAEKGIVNEAEVLVDNPGRYRFYCPASKFEGYFTVFAKSSPQDKQGRTVAGDSVESKPKYWIPRDYDQ